jgi:hypothetical protein
VYQLNQLLDTDGKPSIWTIWPVVKCQTLNFGEHTKLDHWIEKFRDFCNYPVLGRPVLPIPGRILTTATDLAQHMAVGDELLLIGKQNDYLLVIMFVGACKSRLFSTTHWTESVVIW